MIEVGQVRLFETHQFNGQVYKIDEPYKIIVAEGPFRLGDRECNAWWCIKPDGTRLIFFTESLETHTREL